MSRSIPESTDWSLVDNHCKCMMYDKAYIRWKKQQRDLLAMSDDSELWLMQAMITVTAKDSYPEMLAAIRRGPQG